MSKPVNRDIEMRVMGQPEQAPEPPMQEARLPQTSGIGATLKRHAKPIIGALAVVALIGIIVGFQASGSPELRKIAHGIMWAMLLIGAMGYMWHLITAMLREQRDREHKEAMALDVVTLRVQFMQIHVAILLHNEMRR
jgi:hypothetical protein